MDEEERKKHVHAQAMYVCCIRSRNFKLMIPLSDTRLAEAELQTLPMYTRLTLNV